MNQITYGVREKFLLKYLGSQSKSGSPVFHSFALFHAKTSG